MKTIRFGIIGCGLMGREFASAAMRSAHLAAMPARPEIVAICNRSDGPLKWFSDAIPSIRQVTQDYRQVLDNPDVDAVYVALPHHLHEEVYVAAIEAGKHLMGEKPFGIDRAANRRILDAVERIPGLLVRCASQYPFFPAVQQIGRMIDAGLLGRIIEVQSGFLHSSDLDPCKRINWKRMVQYNGQYGVMGDLGMHACHMIFRAGWRPTSVRAVLSKIVAERPDGRGGMAPCETWDNATMLCTLRDPAGGGPFPWTLRTARIAPGERNTWYLEILGTKTSVRFSTRAANQLEIMQYDGGPQSWRQVETGSETAYGVITGPIFEFGFTDALLQMWGAFVTELAQSPMPGRFAGCATPQEVALSHALFDAALQSMSDNAVITISDETSDRISGHEGY